MQLTCGPRTVYLRGNKSSPDASSDHLPPPLSVSKGALSKKPYANDDDLHARSLLPLRVSVGCQLQRR